MPHRRRRTAFKIVTREMRASRSKQQQPSTNQGRSVLILLRRRGSEDIEVKFQGAVHLQ